jgi:hypothetical protein
VSVRGHVADSAAVYIRRTAAYWVWTKIGVGGCGSWVA